MKKIVVIRNVVEVVLSGLLFIIMALKPFFVYEDWWGFGINFQSISDYYDVSMYGILFPQYTSKIITGMLVWLFFGLCVIALALYVIQLFAKSKWRNSLLTLIISGVQLLSFAAFTFYLLVFDNGKDASGAYTHYYISTFFWVFSLVLFVLVLITFVGYFWAKKKNAIFDDTPITPKKRGKAFHGDLDMLMKLKSLLDAGAISQEEFDERKKRIMDNLDDLSNH